MIATAPTNSVDVREVGRGQLPTAPICWADRLNRALTTALTTTIPDKPPLQPTVQGTHCLVSHG
jgi:hypothetical protein